MKRIYFTAVPLQSNFLLEPHPVAPVNFTLGPAAPHTACFPIVPVIADTMQPGDEAVIVAVRQHNEAENPNYDTLRRELQALGLASWTLRDVTVPERQDRDLLLGLFAAMVAELQSNACYYACMTFGTKTYPVVLFSVLAYAEKIKSDAEVKGIYYQELLRREGRTVQARLYDVTALLTLNSIVDQVAAGGPETDREATLRVLLNL